MVTSTTRTASGVVSKKKTKLFLSSIRLVAIHDSCCVMVALLCVKREPAGCPELAGPPP